MSYRPAAVPGRRRLCCLREKIPWSRPRRPSLPAGPRRGFWRLRRSSPPRACLHHVRSIPVAPEVSLSFSFLDLGAWHAIHPSSHHRHSGGYFVENFLKNPSSSSLLTNRRSIKSAEFFDLSASRCSARKSSMNLIPSGEVLRY